MQGKGHNTPPSSTKSTPAEQTAHVHSQGKPRHSNATNRSIPVVAGKCINRDPASSGERTQAKTCARVRRNSREWLTTEGDSPVRRKTAHHVQARTTEVCASDRGTLLDVQYDCPAIVHKYREGKVKSASVTSETAQSLQFYKQHEWAL